MKKILLLAMLLPTLVAAQDHLLREDTAARLVDRYLDILNIDALPHDSLLVLETQITVVGTTDTFLMRRWYSWPQMLRLEVWHGDDMHGGLCTNGTSRYRSYNRSLGYWIDVEPERFYDGMVGYDFRGPLYNWRTANLQLSYKGKVQVTGGRVLESVRVESPNLFTRYYMFEPNGLLAIIIETDEMEGKRNEQSEKLRIEWKCMHEYLSVGSTVLPRLESFLRNGELTVLETKARLEPRRDIIFNSDRP